MRFTRIALSSAANAVTTAACHQVQRIKFMAIVPDVAMHAFTGEHRRCHIQDKNVLCDGARVLRHVGGPGGSSPGARPCGSDGLSGQSSSRGTRQQLSSTWLHPGGG